MSNEVPTKNLLGDTSHSGSGKRCGGRLYGDSYSQDCVGPSGTSGSTSISGKPLNVEATDGPEILRARVLLADTRTIGA